MCNPACLSFGESQITREDAESKRVIELGAYNVNGSLRAYVESFNPESYTGVDLQSGPGVDLVMDVEMLPTRFEPKNFDLVISTEMLEHVRNWKIVIATMKLLLKPGGKLIITTRSEGFPFHEYPGDYWRFSVEDMQEIFSDFIDVVVKADPSEPGVFVSARKPIKGYRPRKLEDIKLYSMQANARV